MKKLLFEKIESNFPFQDHDFDCGVDELNHFFYKNAGDFIREDFSQMYGSRLKDSNEIIGFFTLSCTSIRSEEKELVNIQKIARHVPGILLGMFAVDKKFQEKGIGTDLIKKAVSLSLNISRIVGSRCLIVDSKINERLIKFYQSIGFEHVNDALGMDILQKLEKGLFIKKESIKLYFDFHKIKKP